MSDEATYEPIRAIASEVLELTFTAPGNEQPFYALVHTYRGEWFVGVEELDFETGELYSYPLVSSLRGVIAPELAASLGRAEQAEELVRRLAALPLPREREAPEPRAPEEEAELQAALADLRLKLQLGQGSLPELVSELDATPGADVLLRELFQQLEAQDRDMQSWPAVTEIERLDAALERLREAGVFGMLGAGKTTMDGWDVVQEESAITAAPERGFWGTAFCSLPELESALAGRPFCLTFGRLDDDPSEAAQAEVGRAVCEALTAAGLTPDWNGRAQTRIQLGPFPWRRRGLKLDALEQLELDGGTDFPAEQIERLPQLHTLAISGARPDLCAARSATVTDLTVSYPTEREAQVMFPVWQARAREQFPSVQRLSVCGRSFTGSSTY